jgi:PhnB protein
MTSFNIYLTFDGNCEEAFDFYKSVFGGDFTHVGRFKDMPADPKCQIPKENMEKIMHISYQIDENAILMGSDTGGDWANNYKAGNNFSISVQAESEAHADELFAGLCVDGKIVMPLEKTFWGSYFGMFTDKFGIQWMISYDTSKAN